MASWDDTPALPENAIDDRLYIDVAMVAANPHREREREKQQREEKRRAEARRLARKPEPRAKAPAPAVEKPPPVLTPALKPVQPKAEPAVVQTDESKAGAALDAEAQLRLEQGLALEIIEEQAYRRAVTDDEKAMAYAGQIRREIGQNWSRPPSARNGMQALLKVFLVPTGEVVNVTIEESSGNDAFDRSAVSAVSKSARFQVPEDSRQFERNFREFTVLFRPEDLRL